MIIQIHDRVRNDNYYYDIYDAPAKILLTEETRLNDNCRYEYIIHNKLDQECRKMSFDDFKGIMFFDLAFEPISKELNSWIMSLM